MYHTLRNGDSSMYHTPRNDNSAVYLTLRILCKERINHGFTLLVNLNSGITRPVHNCHWVHFPKKLEQVESTFSAEKRRWELYTSLRCTWHESAYKSLKVKVYQHMTRGKILDRPVLKVVVFGRNTMIFGSSISICIDSTYIYVWYILAFIRDTI